jgi:hypothetical protein
MRSSKGSALACGCAAGNGDIIAVIDAYGSTDVGPFAAEVPSFERSRIHGVSNPNAFSDGIQALLAFLPLRPDLSMSRARAYRGPFPQLACRIRTEYHRRRRATAPRSARIIRQHGAQDRRADGHGSP